LTLILMRRSARSAQRAAPSLEGCRPRHLGLILRSSLRSHLPDDAISAYS